MVGSASGEAPLTLIVACATCPLRVFEAHIASRQPTTAAVRAAAAIAVTAIATVAVVAAVAIATATAAIVAPPQSPLPPPLRHGHAAHAQSMSRVGAARCVRRPL